MGPRRGDRRRLVAGRADLLADFHQLVFAQVGDVPVIDPAILAVKIAEALVDTGLSHSKRTYPHPPEKEIVGY